MTTERTAFPAGVPCWVDTWQPDAVTAATFYAALMGWETDVTPPADAAPQYVMCRLDGRDVAAIGDGAGAPADAAVAAAAVTDASGAGTEASPDAAGAAGARAPAWTTYIRVASVD